ncbi:hypothetical protein L6164_007995 [Bauhinia variegata]|uniref:Uncharacterized protein n=1 Tax=Bauhinia variegata TaxID=167791 RepID=A0ACB9PEG9_BAUVA|nr:hypothetical protein L6164_007995 [Bauhinia variegata]
MKFIASFPWRVMASRQSSIKFASSSSCSVSAVGTFAWDDILGIPPPRAATNGDPSYLHGYFEKIQSCNRGLEKQSEFLPFVIEEQIVGFIHKGFAGHLRSFRDVFIFPKDKFYGNHFDGYVSLHPTLKTHEERTIAVGSVVKSLGEEWIPVIQNELFPVTSSFGAPIFLLLERAATPYFGTKAYGVCANGYAERDGQKQLWIGKRSHPHGIDCLENLVKECQEEAGIPRSMSIQPNSSPVIIDFLFRHGYISPETFGYLDLLRSLRIGDCS